MAILVSKSKSCKDNNDGTMLEEMEIGKKIAEVDCVGLDGGYTQHIGNVLEQDSQLTPANFCFLIRKKRLQQLHPEEAVSDPRSKVHSLNLELHLTSTITKIQSELIARGSST